MRGFPSWLKSCGLRRVCLAIGDKAAEIGGILDQKRTRRIIRTYSAEQRAKTIETFARFGCSAADTIAKLGHPCSLAKKAAAFISDNRITAVSQPMEPGASALFAKPLTNTNFSNGCKSC